VTVGDDDNSFILYTIPASWKSSFSTIDVKMYHTTESHKLRTHKELFRRQDTSATATIGTETPTHSAPHPTATSTSDTNTLDLTSSLVDKKFLPENSPIQIGCKNCSTYGSLDFSFVSFSLSPSLEEILQSPIEMGDFFDGGEVTVVANGMGAHVELITNISLETGDFTFNLFEIPLLFGVAVSSVPQMLCR
jgi:hypothetical protein